MPRFLSRNAPYAISVGGTTNGGLTLANAASLNPTSALTLEAWVYFESFNSTTNIIFDNTTSGVSNSYYLDALTIGTYALFRFISTINGSVVTLNSSLKLSPRTWYFVTATFTGTAVAIRVNGANVGSQSGLTGSMATNSEGLRIGRYHAGTAGYAVNGYIYRPRVYNASCSLVEHQDRYYNDATSASLQAGLVLDLAMTEGAGSTIADISGQNNTATIVSPATWTGFTPFKAGKQINGNLVKNGDFEYAPPLVGATTGSAVWVDGTAAGSATNDLFSWYKINGAGAFAASFDPTATYQGKPSIKLESTNSTGRGRLLSAPTETSTTAAIIVRYGFPVQPNTDYNLSANIKTAGADAASVRLIWLFYQADGTQSGGGTGTNQASTQDFTPYSTRFTTGSNTRYVVIKLDDNVATAAAHQVWFNKVSLTPVYPEGRVPANGNLVKNFNFEVAPTFVAATSTTQRFIDGTAAGSSTNGTYKWAIVASSTAGTFSSQFDSSVVHGGLNSLKLSIGATGSSLNVGSLVLVSAANLQLFGIPVNPNTGYTCTYWMKTSLTSGSATTGAKMFLTEYDSAAGNTVQTAVGTSILTTTDWTQYTITFTTASTTNYIVPRCQLRGNDGAATLIMDAWFDDIYLAKTTNPGKIAIT